MHYDCVCCRSMDKEIKKRCGEPRCSAFVCFERASLSRNDHCIRVMFAIGAVSKAEILGSTERLKMIRMSEAGL